VIWLVWRQHRKQALFALLGLAALAAFLVPTGLQMHHAFEKAGLDDCLRKASRVEFVNVPGPRQDPSRGTDPTSAQVHACRELADQFSSRYGSRATFGILLWFVPLFAGLFWGAPLVAREIEHGTHRLVWTQGVSRLRWALVKFGLVGAGVVLAAAGYALLLTWWRAPLDQATGQRFVSPGPAFDLEGLVPVGYALFAVALGVFGGVLARKNQAAMAITLVGFLAVRLAVEVWARPHFLAPLRRTFAVQGIRQPNELSGDWVYRAGVYSAQGKRIAGGVFGSFSSAFCGAPPTTAAHATATTADPCVLQYGAGAYNQELFHPASRFWLFQGIETALFVAMAVLLFAAAIHWIRRRIS
jgi:hypothetical protein